MAPKTKSPPVVRATDGAPNAVDLGRYNGSEATPLHLDLQVRHLRRLGIPPVRAAVLAPHVFAGAPT